MRQSFVLKVSQVVYISESIHIWTIVTLEGWHSLHDPGPRGGARGKNIGHLKSAFSKYCYRITVHVC